MSKPESEYKQSPEPLDSDVRETGAQVRRRRSNRQPHLETSVNMDELRELIALIQENGFAEFELEREGFRIHVRRDLAHSEATAASAGDQPAAGVSAQLASPAGDSLALGLIHPGFVRRDQSGDRERLDLLDHLPHRLGRGALVPVHRPHQPAEQVVELLGDLAAVAGVEVSGGDRCLGRSGSPHDSVSYRGDLLPVGIAEQ